MGRHCWLAQQCARTRHGIGTAGQASSGAQRHVLTTAGLATPSRPWRSRFFRLLNQGEGQAERRKVFVSGWETRSMARAMLRKARARSVARAVSIATANPVAKSHRPRHRLRSTYDQDHPASRSRRRDTRIVGRARRVAKSAGPSSRRIDSLRDLVSGTGRDRLSVKLSGGEASSRSSSNSSREP